MGFVAPLFMKNHQTPPHSEGEHRECACGNCTCHGESSPTEELVHDEAREEGPIDSEPVCEQNADLEALSQKLQDLEAQEAELNQRLLRLQADFDNYRRRTRKEIQENIVRANEELIDELLPVIDNFERALVPREGASAESIRTGVELVYRQFLDILGKEGLTPIETVGEPFDPHVHDAALVETTCDPALDNHVVQELQKGYCFGDRVLRAAVVKVAKIED